MIAILSDIHANLPALQAVLEDASARGCKKVLSLGDVAGYHAQPGECIDLLIQCGAVNILGNHDHYLTSENNCPRSKFVARIIEYQRSVVTPEQIAWLRDSSPYLRDGRVLYVHGGPNNPMDEYLYNIDDMTLPEGVDYLFSGHTHVQARLPLSRSRWYCNPGSVGQPRDGDCRAGYAIFDGSNIEVRRIGYDISRTVEAMKAAGFEAFFYENLYKGTQIGGRVDRIAYTGNCDPHEH